MMEELSQICNELSEHSSQVIRNNLLFIPKSDRMTAMKTDLSTNLVFIYGTLRQGASNHWRMADAEFVSKADTPGDLYRIDWYPGAKFITCGIIYGEIYRVTPEQLAALDDYEGTEYKRIKIIAITSDRKKITTWAWEYQNTTEHLKPIPSGNWFDSTKN